MRVDRISQLAAHLRTLPTLGEEKMRGQIYEIDARLTQFFMGAWHCGTAGCIAGWAVELFRDGDDDAVPTRDSSSWIYEAMRILGLDSRRSVELFMPELRDVSMGDVRAEQAAAVLDHLAATGVVSWSVAGLRSLVGDCGEETDV